MDVTLGHVSRSHTAGLWQTRVRGSQASPGAVGVSVQEQRRGPCWSLRTTSLYHNQRGTPHSACEAELVFVGKVQAKNMS